MSEARGAWERRYGSLEWRNIGPFRGGRVVAVAGHPTERMTFFMGSTGGGVWKTTNGGTTWRNVSDGFLGSASVGAIQVAEADPNVVYVGMGECSIRGNVSFGDGVYRSDDGGASWRHLGLAATRHIARIRIHPRDPDLVYVAALGHAFGPNPERGVYRSRDGGRTWELVLFRSEDAGAIDLSLDPQNPRILYAAFWEARRGEWFLRSGGPGSGLFRTTDGGDTWVEITRNKGLPEGVWGKVGVAVSPAREGRVWALVEAEKGGVYRSDDGGESWRLVSDEPRLRSRPWYYSHIHAHPTDPETVFVLTEGFWVSTDGGHTFRLRPTPHGDHHDLWIDPRDPDRMIHGADGGATVSFDGGRSWSSIFNQPTGEFYHVTVDTRFPYRVYGAQQDNTTISIASASRQGAITEQDWWDVGGAESGYIAVRPDDPDVVYAGSSGGGEGGRLTRFDQRTGERREITPWPARTAGMAAEEYRYRFQWTSPIHISPHDPNVLYFCANRVFRSRDEGESWEIISPDLTRNDPEKLGPSGGPITRDHTGVEVYGTIFAFAESPLAPGLLWAGSDDGRVHVSRDAGASWTDVTPPDMPEWTRVSIVEPSPHNPDGCYLAASRYRLDDRRPYLWKTTDLGKTWQRITDGIPDEDYTRVIRADPVRPGLLFCGTETGVYVSRDDGASWQRMNLNLPVVPVHDLAVQDGDLVAATHGRAFWILDDITPLRQDVPEDDVWLFRPRDTVRVRYAARGRMSRPKMAAADALPGPTGIGGGLARYLKDWPEGGRAPEYLDAGRNPPNGVIVHFG
ncbi:MAG: glycosyl hydrolase, partial [Clostridia bacterium]|nr:glycosyl hydrolase [Clostridia bacterium]